MKYSIVAISIHAPLRERRLVYDKWVNLCGISIHAPLRERPPGITSSTKYGIISIHAPLRERRTITKHMTLISNFNPRSLTGATSICSQVTLRSGNFNPRSLTGATRGILYLTPSIVNFNPRSLTGATTCRTFAIIFTGPFQSTLPYGSDSIKTNYFSINLSQAFFANRLNSNTQEFYFDVRKLLVSHSSPGCEPKLNYMFHITSHRIILHYFSSCQSICK